MNSSDVLLIVALILSYIVVFVLGFGCGYLVWCKNNDTQYIKPTSFLKSQGKEDIQKDKIEIDDAKVVLGLNTDSYIKKFDNMGTETKVKNDVISSVNKLKNMKGK